MDGVAITMPGVGRSSPSLTKTFIQRTVGSGREGRAASSFFSLSFSFFKWLAELQNHLPRTQKDTEEKLALPALRQEHVRH